MPRKSLTGMLDTARTNLTDTEPPATPPAHDRIGPARPRAMTVVPSPEHHGVADDQATALAAADPARTGAPGASPPPAAPGAVGTALAAAAAGVGEGPATPAPGPGLGPGPRYLTLVRKEARLTDDQADALTVLTRRLNKNRARRGERITDNTLIRVAVDLLLAQQDQLAGTTETELRHSVGL